MRKGSQMVVRCLILIGVMVSIGAHAYSFEAVAVLSGMGKAKDGDGIVFGKVEVRLQGIAAPEDSHHKTEPGGKASTLNLKELVDGELVVCHLDGSTAGKRPVGVCFVDGIEVNKHQIATGHARDCPAFSKGRYNEDEVRARKAGNNLSLIYDLPDYCS